ncbi:MAG: nuclear transport factor 2 family protein [Myxococcota bacterium]
MIEQTIERWHRVLDGDFDLLDELLADDVIFYSPVVFTPQKGKAVTRMYLGGAAKILGVDDPERPADAPRPFQYTKEILCGHHAALEFETEVGGRYVNGMDIITCDDEGRIVEFRVMIRPLQAIQVLHAEMAKLLKALQDG